MNFIISIPVWGAWHTHLARHTVLPSVLAALDYANMADQARFIIHTPNPDSFGDVLYGRNVQFLPLAPHSVEYLRFAASHKEALSLAGHGDVVCLLCADIIVSRELFSFTATRFAEGKSKAINVLGPRTLFDPDDHKLLPIKWSGRDLSKWTVEHAHPITQENAFDFGQSRWPSTVYFRDFDGTSCHAFHLHPIMVMKDRPLGFSGTTIDDDLADCFQPHEIFTVTNNEFSICEVSPPDKEIGLGNVLTEDEIYQWAKQHTSIQHRWNFAHRIVLTGTGANSQPTVDKILARFECIP